MKNRKWIVATLVFLAPAAYATDHITLKLPITFDEAGDIATAVRKECALEDVLAKAIIDEAKRAGIEVSSSESAATSDAGAVLTIEITDAIADGNAYFGHRKSVSAKGNLFRDGVAAGRFKDRRATMGGAFAQFKGNCSVLSRATKAIGKDVATWLTAPVMTARLGDLD